MDPITLASALNTFEKTDTSRFILLFESLSCRSGKARHCVNTNVRWTCDIKKCARVLAFEFGSKALVQKARKELSASSSIGKTRALVVGASTTKLADGECAMVEYEGWRLGNEDGCRDLGGNQQR